MSTTTVRVPPGERAIDDHAVPGVSDGDGGVRRVRVPIVGTGFSGLGMAIRLQQDGIEDYVVLERADDVGGTWRDNTYPGAACDVPSHLYSFSFAPNPNWTRTFSRQAEIEAYLRECAERHRVSSHVLYGHEVTDARWVEDERRWHVSTSRGRVVAEVLVAGMGPLTVPPNWLRLKLPSGIPF